MSLVKENATVDIFAVIKSNVSTLKAASKYGLRPERKGSKYWTLCPFHEDKNPSMCIYPRGGFKCYSCGTAGQDSIKLTEILFNLKPLEAVEKLSGDFNIPVAINKEIDKEKLQVIRKTERELEQIAKIIKNRTEVLYSNMCLMYRTFKEVREEADSAGIDKSHISYQWLLFNENFFDRYTEIIAKVDTGEQIKYVLHIEDYYRLEVGEFRHWIKQLKLNGV